MQTFLTIIKQNIFMSAAVKHQIINPNLRPHDAFPPPLWRRVAPQLMNRTDYVQERWSKHPEIYLFLEEEYPAIDVDKIELKPWISPNCSNSYAPTIITLQEFAAHIAFTHSAESVAVANINPIFSSKSVETPEAQRPLYDLWAIKKMIQEDGIYDMQIELTKLILTFKKILPLIEKIPMDTKYQEYFRRTLDLLICFPNCDLSSLTFSEQKEVATLEREWANGERPPIVQYAHLIELYKNRSNNKKENKSL